jgi:chromodomain-helicase-DNA-binding protein 6
MQPLINAVKNAGGPRAALDAAEWLSERPEVKNVEEHCDKPAPWWSPRDDRGLLVGTLRHGWGRWDAIRADPELGLEASWESAIAAANGSPEPSAGDDAAPPSTGRRSKRKRSSAGSPGSAEASKENTPLNKRSKPERSPAKIVLTEPSTEVIAVEWPLNRVLSLRVRRLCAALGGKLAVQPPAPKLPREKKARNPREQRGPGARGPRAAALGNMDKVERAKMQIDKLPRDKKGRVRLPVGPVQGVTLECLGVVQPADKLGYHSAAYILPVGYRTTRQYMRCDDPNGERTRWVQEILEGDNGPAFKLTADEGLDEPIVAKSATAAWAEVLKRVTAARAALGEEPKKTAISGPEFFGYSLPHIRLLVEELPGVAECEEYQPLLERQAKQADEPAEGEAMDVDAA